MKKRKELNALIGIGGDSKRKKPKKGSGHRLLRTEPPDSDTESSSEEDEFGGSFSSVAAFGKRGYAQCCRVCYPLCAFIILAACVVACAGLVWMQIALKEDLDSLKEKLHTMDSGQKASALELPRLAEQLKDKERVLEDIVSGDRGLNQLWANLTEISRKISALDSAVSHLKANIKSASDLITLPSTVEELQKSVATMGSTLTSVQHDMSTVQDEAEQHRQAVESLRRSLDGSRNGSERSSAGKSPNCSAFSEIRQELLYVQESVGELNSTQTQAVSQLQLHMAAFGTALSHLSLRVSSLETGGAAAGKSNISSAELPPSPDSTQQEPHGPAPSTAWNPPRHPASPPQSVTKKDLGMSDPAPISLPGVHSLTDFERLFAGLKEAPPPDGLSYEDVMTLFGKGTPDSHTLEPFDKNGDGKYSKAELRAAAGV